MCSCPPYPVCTLSQSLVIASLSRPPIMLINVVCLLRSCLHSLFIWPYVFVSLMGNVSPGINYFHLQLASQTLTSSINPSLHTKISFARMLSFNWCRPMYNGDNGSAMLSKTCKYYDKNVWGQSLEWQICWVGFKVAGSNLKNQQCKSSILISAQILLFTLSHNPSIFQLKF